MITIEMMIDNFINKEGLKPVFKGKKKITNSKYKINLMGGYSKTFEIIDDFVMIDGEVKYLVDEIAY